MSKVNICADLHLFVNSENGRTAMREGCIAFVTEEGMFAALGHREKDGDISYVGSDVYSAITGDDVGQVLHSTETGVYGTVYEGCNMNIVDSMEVASFDEIEEGNAEMIMPFFGKAHRFNGNIVALFKGKPHPVIFEADRGEFPGASFGSSGGVITQNGKLIAIVAGANENPANLLYCTSAEQMVNDLNTYILSLNRKHRTSK